jgi:hypothetical protein
MGEFSVVVSLFFEDPLNEMVQAIAHFRRIT